MFCVSPALAAACVAQLMLATGSLGWLALRAPEEGVMLAVPFSDSARHGLAAHLTAQGGRLLAPGRFEGSYLVAGRRDALARTGLLLVTGSAPSCGDAPEAAR